MVIAAALLSLVLTTPLTDCRAHYLALRYRDAVTSCGAALVAAEESERTELYQLVGLSLTASGDPAQAQRVFGAMLALNPNAELPKDLSPKLREPFEAARPAARQVVVSATAQPSPTGELDVEVSVEDGANAPVQSLKVQVGDANVQMLRTTAPRQQLHLPHRISGTTEATVSALDGFGISLATAMVPVVAASTTHSLWRSWRTYAVAALVLAAGGAGALTWAALDYRAARAEPFADRAAALKGEADRAYVAGSVSLGLCGAAALAALIAGVTQ